MCMTQDTGCTVCVHVRRIRTTHMCACVRRIHAPPICAMCVDGYTPPMRKKNNKKTTTKEQYIIMTGVCVCVGLRGGVYVCAHRDCRKRVFVLAGTYVFVCVCVHMCVCTSPQHGTAIFSFPLVSVTVVNPVPCLSLSQLRGFANVSHPLHFPYLHSKNSHSKKSALKSGPSCVPQCALSPVPFS